MGERTGKGWAGILIQKAVNSLHMSKHSCSCGNACAESPKAFWTREAVFQKASWCALGSVLAPVLTTGQWKARSGARQPPCWQNQPGASRVAVLSPRFSWEMVELRPHYFITPDVTQCVSLLHASPAALLQSLWDSPDLEWWADKLQATSADNPDTFNSIFDFFALPVQNSEENLHKPEWMSGCTIFNTGPPLVNLFLCPVSKKEGEAKWWAHSEVVSAFISNKGFCHPLFQINLNQMGKIKICSF